MRHEPINPVSLGAPIGYSNGMLAAPGRLLFVAGQIGWTSEQKLISKKLFEQFGQALANLLEVVQQAGGGPEHICRLTIYVTDKGKYLESTKKIGKQYRALMKSHYPAMSLVEVADLLEEGAKVEIEATAVVPERGRR